MKKRVFIVVFLLILVLTGGFLLLDKFYFHFVFKVTPGSCLILEEKYCKKLVRLDLNGNKIVVAKLPEGTILFSPINGQYNNTLHFKLNEVEMEDLGAEFIDGDSRVYNMVYSKLSEIENNDEYLITKGEQIGKISSKMLNNFNNYNFVFLTAKKDNNNKIEIDSDFLLKMMKLND